MPDFTEVAPRVWVAHYDWMHVNITLIGGSVEIDSRPGEGTTLRFCVPARRR